jgi:hypothetical protein
LCDDGIDPLLLELRGSRSDDLALLADMAVSIIFCREFLVTKRTSRDRKRRFAGCLLQISEFSPRLCIQQPPLPGYGTLWERRLAEPDLALFPFKGRLGREF